MKKKTSKKPTPKAKAKAKPAVKAKSARKKGKKKSFSKLTRYSSGMQKSPFLAAVQAAVLDSATGASKWPLASAGAATAIPDLAAALTMMVMVADNKSPTASATPGFAEQTVIDQRQQLPWPAPGDADVPAVWKTGIPPVSNAAQLRAFRLWEAAWATTYFLESWAKSGGGAGGTPNFPPPPPP